MVLETLRTDQRPEQIHKKQQRDDSDNDVFHGLQPPACVSVENADRKECDGCSDEDQIHHGVVLLVVIER